MPKQTPSAQARKLAATGKLTVAEIMEQTGLTKQGVGQALQRSGKRGRPPKPAKLGPRAKEKR